MTKRAIADALIWLVQKLEMGLRIAAKLLLIVPVLLAIVYFNYKIDPSGIFRTHRDVLEVEALALLDGKALTGYDQLAERKVLALYVQNLAEQERSVETIALGSSRILQLRQETVGTSFYNCGMSGADFHDIFGSYYLFERAGVLPENVIISLDAWLFNANPDAYYYESDEDLYNEFVALALGIDNGFVPVEEPEPDLLDDIRSGKYNALLDPGYYQAAIQYYIDKPELEERQPSVVTGDIYTQSTNIKLSDGSVVYQQDFRTAPQEDVNRLAVGQAGTFARMEDFYVLDEELIEIFTLSIEHMQAQGVNVVFLMAPYHPTVYNYATENAERFTGFFAAQEWYIEYALANDIPLYGSYNPFVLGCTEEDFYDGLHIREESLAELIPNMATIKKQQAEGRAGSDWLYADVLVEYEVAEDMVAGRYGIQPPQYIVRDEEQDIHGEACYVMQRWGVDETTDSDDIVLLAWYAVTQTEGVVYRLDTELEEWVVDSRF